MKIKLIKSNNLEWLNKWDKYVYEQEVSSHLLYSDWNRSFKSYGFDFEVNVLLNEDKIIGGYAAVIPKIFFFRFYIVPFGPVCSDFNFQNLNILCNQVKTRAKENKCCYCHITLPNSKLKSPASIDIKDITFLDSNYKRGHRFNYVYSSNGVNWKAFNNIDNDEELIMSFKSSTRRYIRSSLRKDLEIIEAKSIDLIEKGYQLCLLNAKKNNYALRDWNSIKSTIFNLINSNKAKFILAQKDGELKGASLIIETKSFSTYILGGTIKEKPDVLAGHFLHFQACKLAMNQKKVGYNISLGGSDGVLQLKNGYADYQIYYENSKYHFINKPIYFKIYLLIDKFIKKYKKPISFLLTKFK